MKVAIIHEWLDGYAGSERVLEQLLLLYPQAELFAVCDFLPAAERGFLGGRVPTTSFIQRLPRARQWFRYYLGLMPIAVEQFDLSAYDLVISSSHAVAKGVLTGPGTLHVAYVHSPMRYAWDLQHQYLRQSRLDRGVKGLLTRWLLARLRAWDHASGARPDVIAANSAWIAGRIRKAWRRDSVVVHPPVDLDGFPFQPDKQDHYVVASRLVPYKRIDLIAAAFARMPDRRLVIAGDGPEMARVREAAAGAPNIAIRGRVPQAELVALLQSARAFVFAAEEDFGIALVEAQACGTPLVAFARGGASDIVQPDETGLLFPDQTAESIMAAVARFESLSIAPAACRANAERFSRAAFRARMQALVEEALAARGGAA
ncbi:glycosyltransferase [Falsiroseomonas selenitidurans]|uniref:Glycosyltransferase family 4 protein n=1 Tax=Falsiroseomonas selenitidurans TaxID=2716335 RepID=A0ABX1E4N5_9PROT|nr:glycosyltransferase [Falsiroseomonas selenitidurans]NKC32147.1 glycosyltransferase family 4 protein [Falsiroseomonas selenitidurans]